VVRAKAINRKIVVEGSRPLNAQPAHDSEARSVDNRKILIAIGHPDLPGSFQVRYADCLHNGDTVA